MSAAKLLFSTLTGLSVVICGCATPNAMVPDVARQLSVPSPPPAAQSGEPLRLVGFLESDSVEVIGETAATVSEQKPMALAGSIADQAPATSTTVNDLASFEARALANHPAIQQQRALIQAARGSWLQAGLPMNPVAQYQSDEIGNDDSSGLHQLQINQTIVTANKLGLARSVAASEVRKVQADLARAELQVLTAVRTAFIAALIAQQRVQQTETLLSIAKQSVQSVQNMLEAQEVSRIALLQSQTAADQAELALQNATASERAARRSLAAAVSDQVVSDEILRGDLGELLPEAPWESLLSELVAASPELAKNNSEIERARRALQLACAQVTPNVTTQFGLGYDAATDNTFAMLGVSVPLPIRNRNEGNIAQARADIAAAHAAVQQTELDLNRRLADAVGRYQVAKQRVEMLEQTIIPRAEETLGLSRQSFEAGETSYLELLTIQRTLSQTHLNVLDAVEQARIAAAEIDGLLVSVGQ